MKTIKSLRNFMMDSQLKHIWNQSQARLFQSNLLFSNVHN